VVKVKGQKGCVRGLNLMDSDEIVMDEIAHPCWGRCFDMRGGALSDRLGFF